MGTTTRFAWLVVALGTVIAAGACNDEDAVADGWTVEEGDGGQTDFGTDETVIVQSGDEDGETTIITGDGDGCVELEDGSCVDPEEVKEQYCEDTDAQADIIVNEDGEVVDVICYPPKDGGTPLEEVAVDEEGTAEVPQTENGAVITFDESTDGEPLEGDVTLTAEGVTIFGNGVDKTIIDGNLTFSTNAAQARGLTVTGDVTFDLVSNTSKLAFCKIHGDLTVRANEVTVANCQVFGNVLVTGRNGSLVNIGVQGSWDVDASTYCEGCYSFADDNDDQVVDTDERGDELLCDGGPNSVTNNTAGTNNLPGTNNTPGPNNLPGM